MNDLIDNVCSTVMAVVGCYVAVEVVCAIAKYIVQVCR